MNNPQSSKAPQLPYTAEFKTTRVQTISSGATITHESTETSARDSQGRTITSTSHEAVQNGHEAYTSVNVNDPVARTHSSWVVPGHAATVTKMPEPGERANCATTIEPKSTSNTPTHAPVAHDRPTVEDLGTEEIMGLQAKGWRTSTVIPAGQIGNDAPLTRTNEFWTAVDPGLRNLTVRSVSNDPQNGQNTKELTSFTQGDPDPSLFQPPSDYEIVTREANTGCSSSSTSVTAPVASQE